MFLQRSIVFILLRALYGIAMGREWIGASLTMESIPAPPGAAPCSACTKASPGNSRARLASFPN